MYLNSMFVCTLWATDIDISGVYRKSFWKAVSQKGIEYMCRLMGHTCLWLCQWPSISHIVFKLWCRIWPLNPKICLSGVNFAFLCREHFFHPVSYLSIHKQTFIHTYITCYTYTNQWYAHAYLHIILIFKKFGSLINLPFIHTQYKPCKATCVSAGMNMFVCVCFPLPPALPHFLPSSLPLAPFLPLFCFLCLGL